MQTLVYPVIEASARRLARDKVRIRDSVRVRVTVAVKGCG